jgi:histidine triad (HIT) family protein
MDCLFCKILNKEVQAPIIYQNESVFVLNDINPQAAVHKLIIPKKHISSLNELTPTDTNLMGELFQTAKSIAADAGVAEDGYRVVVNCNAGAGQTVFHIHVHLLGGRQLSWPPG